VKWRIEQQDPNTWKVYKGEQVHWANNAKDAVALMLALEEAGR
jgi:hypothetical protein